VAVDEELVGDDVLSEDECPDVTLVVGDDAKQDLDDDEYIWLAHGESESAYVRGEL
jgi:hypothetical protein